MIDAIQKNVTWRAIPIAGLCAAIAFLAVHIVFSPVLYEVDPFFILYYMGAIVLGSDVLIETTLSTAVVGFVVHLFLSLIFTLVISIVIHRWGFVIGLIGGGLLGLALYAINFYTMTVWFEWMFVMNTPLLVICHLIFGAVAGGIYESMDTYDVALTANEEVKA